MSNENVNIIVNLKDKASRGVKSLSKNLKKMGDMAASASKKASIGFLALAGALGVSIRNARTQQLAINKLNQSLINTGNYSEEASKDLQEYAAQLQAITTFGDEAIISAQSLIASFGFEGKVLKELTAATLDLASAKGMELQSAADLVAKSVGSSTNALTRYGISVDGAAGSTERASSAVENINSLFGGQAQAAAKGLGSIVQLKNAFGDLTEKIAFALAPQIESITNWLNRMVSIISNNDRAINTIAKTIGILTIGLGTTAIALKSLSLGFAATALASRSLALSMSLIAANPIIAGLMIIATGLTFLAVKTGVAGKAIKDLKNSFSSLESAKLVFKSLLIEVDKMTSHMVHKFKVGVLTIKGLFKSTTDEIAEIQKEHNEKINKLNDEQDAINSLRLEMKLSSEQQATNKIEQIKQSSKIKQLSESSDFFKRQKGMFDQFNEHVLTMTKGTIAQRRALEKSFSTELQGILQAGISPDGLDFSAMGEAIKASLRNQLTIWAAAEVAKALMAAPLTFGASLFALPIIAAKLAAGITAINAVKFNDGGIVQGTSYTGDKVPALMNSGEMVLNRHQQQNLFDAINSGAVGGGGINVTFTGPVLGDESQARDFAMKLDEELFKLKQNNQSIAFN